MNEAWKRYQPTDDRCQVIYNGLDATPYNDLDDPDCLRDELSLDPDTHLYLHVARFVPAKNHTKTIGIFAKIARRDPEAHLLLVGRGGTASEEQCRDQVAALALDDRVTFTGLRSDVPRFMRAGDVMLLPSLQEGLPGVVLEACAAGLPVVASDLPGTEEIAEQFSGVTCLPLSASNTEWARVATEVCGTRVDQATALARYQASDFTIEASIDALTGVWTSAERDDHGR